jgi:hypothetical protein
MTIKQNGVKVADDTRLYPYQAWILKQFKYGSGLKDFELSKEGYYTEKIPDDYSTSNTSCAKRFTLASGSKSMEFVGKICDGIFHQDRYTSSNIAVDVELVKMRIDFAYLNLTS